MIVTPLCLLRSMESLGPTSFLGACCVLFTSAVVSIHGLSEAETTPGHAAELVSFNLTAFQAISIVRTSSVIGLVLPRNEPLK